ncbi:hypothetical protein GCM10008938_17080 [Deinococcus roseus]|uniref:YibE/F family protein n=2 Tax=Deinococcus roseus TaxID=392414 RepID=A0ABQ2CXW8_9DEIO|nr:hypothetical protein GCM10008938_17080 [Deinococcus roseus]
MGAGFAQDTPPEASAAQLQSQSQTLEGTISQLDPLMVKVGQDVLPLTHDGNLTVKLGDLVQVFQTLDPAGNTVYYLADFVRWPYLLGLTLLFVVVAGVVGKGKGIRAVLGMFLSVAVILLMVIPLILAGWNPAFVALLGSAGILLFSVYFVHGFNWTTTAALLATLLTAAVSVGLAALSMHFTHLTGLMDEETMFLKQMGITDLRGLLLGGMIIGALGALVDSTIPQVAVVRELAHLHAGHDHPKQSWQSLFAASMRVGMDHIGSLVNTLVLAYAGSSLSLFVLFQAGNTSLKGALNMEVVSSAIVQSLVGSIGLILAVPLATFIACMAYQYDRLPAPKEGEGHHHHH